MAWSGVSDRHGLSYTLHVIDVERRAVRHLPSDHLGQVVDELSCTCTCHMRMCTCTQTYPQTSTHLHLLHLGQVDDELPAPRGGALSFPLHRSVSQSTSQPASHSVNVAGPGALLLTGSDHDDGEEMLRPWAMSVVLNS